MTYEVSEDVPGCISRPFGGSHYGSVRDAVHEWVESSRDTINQVSVVTQWTCRFCLAVLKVQDA